jgi:hypothetical protein
VASAALRARLVALDVVHMNAEFARQLSDHDPLVARFAFRSTRLIRSARRRRATHRRLRPRRARQHLGSRLLAAVRCRPQDRAGPGRGRHGSWGPCCLCVSVAGDWRRLGHARPHGGRACASCTVATRDLTFW